MGQLIKRASAALLAVAINASLGLWSPVLAAPTEVRPQASAASATTTVPFVATTTDPIAGGVVHHHGRWTTTAGPQIVDLIDVDPAAPGIGLETSGASGGVNDLETVRSQAGRVSRDGHRVISAINADVWGKDEPSNTLAPGGLQVHLGELVSGTAATKPTLGFDAAEQPQLGDVSLRAKVTMPDGTTSLTIDRVNKPRRSGDLILYTRRWGASTHTLAGGTEVVLTGATLPLRPSGTWTASIASILPGGRNTAIPSGSLVLSAQGSDATALAALTRGSILTITTTITSGWEGVVEAVSGREWLVEASAVSVRPVSDLTIATHPRTAVALRADGRLVLATVDGRWDGRSVGVTAVELAGMLLDGGAAKAILLDGGGSTTAFIRRPGDVGATLLNHPSDGFEREVVNALFVTSSIPTGPLDAIVVRPGDARPLVGETIGFQARGVDSAMNGISIAGTPVTWSETGSAGNLASNGVFRALEPGDATVTATVGLRSATATVTVVPDTSPPRSFPPIIRLRKSAAAAASSVPVTISWPAATDIGTGVARYDLRRRLDGGAWADVSLPTAGATSVGQSLPPGRAVQYEVRATDRAGNIGPWRTGSAFHLRLASERSSAVGYGGTWRTYTSSAYLGGAIKTARIAGKTASYTFTGSQVAWIAPRGPTRGSARVYLDGKYVASVNLKSSTFLPRRLVFTHAWSKVARHRVTIKVSGTGRVDVDGFAVVDSASAYPVLVGAGDISSCSNTGDSATAALLTRIPGTIFTAGDNAYESGTTAQYASCYDPTWGRHESRTRPVPGNHEYVTAKAAPYYAYFGSRAGTPGQGWYAYDVGSWRIYSLNSNCASIGGCGAGSAQETWLRADLAANPRACVAAIWHHPLFSSGLHGGTTATRPLWQALQEAGADVVINGHDHDYERFAPQRSDGTADAGAGIREFVVGTGGRGLRAFSTARPNSVVRKTGVLGVLKFELKAGSYTWQFVPVSGSTWSDSGSADCH
jgi:phosphodiester glycosidase/calcineurin-like phosphoesterase family protein